MYQIKSKIEIHFHFTGKITDFDSSNNQNKMENFQDGKNKIKKF